VHSLLDRHKSLSDRLHQGGRHIGKAAREAHATVGKALTRLRQSSESLITAESPAELHAALLQLSTPARELKSGLDRLEGTVDAAEALSHVHSLLDRHKSLSDRLHQGGRHIGKAAMEAHTTVGKALTRLRQDSESVIAAGTQTELNAALLQLGTSAGVLKSGLDRLEGTVNAAKVLSSVNALLDRHTELSDRLHQGGRRNSKAARGAHGAVGKALRRLRESSETTWVDLSAAAGSRAALHGALLQLDKPASDLKDGLDHLEATADATEGEDEKDAADKKSKKKVAAASQKDVDEDVETDDKQQNDEDEGEDEKDAADKKSKKKVAAASQKDVDEDVETDDKQQNDEDEGEDEKDAADKTSKITIAASEEEDGEEDQEEAHEKSKKKMAAASQEDEGEEEDEEQQQDEEAHGKKKSTALPRHEDENEDEDEEQDEDADKEDAHKLAALERDIDSLGATVASFIELRRTEKVRGSGKHSELLEIRRRPDASAPLVGSFRAGERFRVHRQRRTSNGEVWLELADGKGFVSQAQAARVNVGRMEALGLLDAGRRVRDESEDPVSQDPMANGFPKKVAPKHDVDHDAMGMKKTKMSVKGLPEESSYENGKTETADWRNEYKWSTEAPSEIERNGATRSLPLAAALATGLAWALL